ncbi:Asp-tRNA(Asn)/Glu-tRNA(Gln) amidotransferase subunit GatA [Candidatus Saccharibacteria bacterium]|nr:Asp-tRNA(Asn)/Glu-tRNA(Gln) amidotransferase subunit GatA [Candidatus Saccharibacteria bacterium]
MPDIAYYSGRTARQNVEEALRAVDEHSDHHAFLHITRERALERADRVDSGAITGRLAGVPFAVKDNYLAFDGPTTAASTMLKDFEAPLQATAVERLEQEGAICIGKTNLDSFAHGSSTENSAYGPTKNAIDPSKVAGGSSGGSAAAVALGIVPFALGTDTGGSIRQPASFNGVVGVKPTYGMISRFGVVSMASSTDVMGCFATTARDAELVTSIMAGKDDKDATSLDDFFQPSIRKAEPTTALRIGVIEDFMGDGTDQGIRDQVSAYVDHLKRQGHTVEPVALPMAQYSLAVYYIVVPAEIASNLARYDGVRYGARSQDATTLDDLYGQSRERGFVTETKRRILIGNYVLSSGYFDAYYQKAQQVRALIMAEFDDMFEKYDLLVSPVTPTTAFGFGENTEDPMKMYMSDVMTVGVSLAGLPALSVPGGESGGLPVGIQLIAKQKNDALLFRVADSMEAHV